MGKGIVWKRRGIPFSGVPETGPTPAPPAPGPTPTVAPIINPAQVFTIREDAAVGTELTAIVATRSPTSWSIQSGNTNAAWTITNTGKPKTLKTLQPANIVGSYALQVIAYNPLASAPEYIVINVTAAATPPPAPGGGGTTGGVPNSILNLATAPAATLFTSGISTLETWPPGEWPSAVRSGPDIGENNTWDIGSTKWNLAFIANGATAISAGQFHQRVGVGVATAEDCVTYELHAKFPGGAKPAGAVSEVTSYPSVLMGQIMSWAHRQLRLPANVPRQVGSIGGSFWVGAKSYNTTGTTCKGHLCDDMRIGNSALPSSTYTEAVAQTTMEFMIVRKTFSGYGLGPGARPSGSHRGTLTIGGIEYYIHTQQGATDFGGGNFATLLCFVPTSGNLPDHANYAHVLNFCCTTRWNQLPNGPGSRFERGRNSGDFMIQPGSYMKHTGQGFEIDGTQAGEVHIVANSAYYRMALD
jgi:hypothetical protein